MQTISPRDIPLPFVMVSLRVANIIDCSLLRVSFMLLMLSRASFDNP